MMILGLTGSIGTGKSTTAAMFAARGIRVHDADAAVHRLYAGRAAAPVGAAFPGTVVDNRVDRAKLSAALMAEPTAFKRLEAIVHPLVREEETTFLAIARAEGARLVILDIPLLFETGGDQRVDATLVVTCSAAIQKERVLARAGMTAEKFAAILAKQMPDAQKRRGAHFIVDSSFGMAAARRQVADICRAVSAVPGRKYGTTS